MGCCLSRNKNPKNNEEIDETQIDSNSDLRRILKEKETVLEGPQTGVPSKRNNNSVIEDYPESNPIMEESFKKTRKKVNGKKNQKNLYRDENNDSSFIELDQKNNEFKNDYEKYNLLKSSQNESVTKAPKSRNNDNTLILKILSFELTLADFYNVFRIKLEPILNIYFEHLSLEFDYSSLKENLNDSTISVSKPNANTSQNKAKSQKYLFNENQFSIKLRSVLNDNSFIILRISNKKENDFEKVSFVIGEGNLPLNLIIYKLIADVENEAFSIPIINIVENTVIGMLSVEVSCNFELDNNDIEETILSRQKNKLGNYLSYKILNYVDIEKKLRKKYFKDNLDKSLIEQDQLEIIFSDKLKILLFSGKFTELKEEIMTDENFCNERIFYYLLYILNEIIENDQYKKVDQNFFQQSFLYQFFETKKNFVLFEIQLKFFIKVQEKNLLNKEFKYQFINIEKIVNYIKNEIYPFIMDSLLQNYENLEKNGLKIKNMECFVNFSDSELICLKNILYHILYLIRITLNAEIELDINEKDKSKIRINEMNKNIITQMFLLCICLVGVYIPRLYWHQTRLGL